MKATRKKSAVRAGLAAVTLFATAACGLTACSSSDGSGGSKTDGKNVNVVATTTQICDYVTQIATDNSKDAKLSFTKINSEGKESHAGADKDKADSSLKLTCLLAPNASAHDHEMTPQQMKALGEADVFFVSGVDLEHFLDSAVESSGFKGTMGVTSGVYTADEVDNLDKQLDKEKSLPYKVYRGEDKVKVAPWPFPPEEGQKEPEFKYDPHVWTSPENTMVQVKNIGATLDKVSPDNKELFDQHVQKFQDQLKALDDWARDSLNSVPKDHRVLFTSHDAFGYFSKTYDVEFIGAAMSDFNAQQDATAEHIREAAETVKKSGALALFAENSNNSRSIEAVANAAGVKAVIGDDALYGDSLGPDGSDGQTYIGSILHNVTNLVTAWNGDVKPIPESLQDYAPKQVLQK